MPAASSSGTSSGCTGLSGAAVCERGVSHDAPCPVCVSLASSAAGIAASRTISTCAATEAAIAAGALSLIVVSPIGQTSLPTVSAAMPILCIAEVKRARLVALPISPT